MSALATAPVIDRNREAQQDGTRRLLQLDSFRPAIIRYDQPKRSLDSTVTKLDRLRANWKSAPTGNDGSVLAHFNLGSLIQYHYGAMDRAHALAEAALDVCSYYWEATGNPVWTAWMIEPYTNLARLACFRGDFDTARRIYDEILAFAGFGERLVIRGTCLDRDALPSVITFPSQGVRDLRRDFAIGYMKDHAQACLMSGDYNALLDLLDRVERCAPRLEIAPACAMLELRARALAGLGDFDGASRILLECRARLRVAVPFPAMLFLGLVLLKAELLMDNDEFDSARKSLDVFLNTLERVDAQTAQTGAMGNLCHRAALLHLVAGRNESARALAERARDISDAQQNEVGVLRSLVLLHRASIGTTSEASAAADLEAAIENTFYCFEKAIALWDLAGAKHGADRRRLLRRSEFLLSRMDAPRLLSYRRLIERELDGPVADDVITAWPWRNPRVETSFDQLMEEKDWLTSVH